jgi:uncharacterized protein YraI
MPKTRLIRWRILSISLLVLMLTTVTGYAQGNIAGSTITALNARTGPDTEYPVVAIVPIHTNIIIEGRNTIGNWVLIHTADGGVRGWVASRYTTWNENILLASIPVTDELLAAPPTLPEANNNVPDEPVTIPATGGISGMTLDLLNIRSGPGTENPAVGKIAPRTSIVIEGRNTIGNWVLIHAADNSVRGWVASRYTTWDETITLANIPVVQETVAALSPVIESSVAVDTQGVSEAEAQMMGRLAALPVVPSISGTVHVIYQHGLELGNNPQNFTKIGDSNSVSQAYLGLIGQGLYNLGSYGYLQATIDYYKGGSENSFTAATQTASSGMLTTTVLDPTFADPRYCGQGTSSLECELSRSRPSIALIYLGMMDNKLITHEQYYNALRQIVETCINWGTVPVLTTLPTKPHYQQTQQRPLEFDMIVLDIAQQYDVPVVNMWRAVRDLPEHGILDDLLHFTYSGVDVMNFNGDQNTWGYTMWNLAVLQTLDAIRNAVG